jgi:hypothetical protein
LKSCKEFEWTLHTFFWIGIGRIVTLLPYMLSANPTLTFDQLPINNVVVIITWNGQESIAKWKHRSKREPGLQALYNILLEFTNCDQSSPILKQQLTELRIQQWLKITTATSIAHPFFHWPPKQVSLHSAPNTLLSAGFEIDSPWNPGFFWWSCRNEVYPMEHDFLLYRDMFWTCWSSSGGLAGTLNRMKTKELQALLAHFLLQRK